MPSLVPDLGIGPISPFYFELSVSVLHGTVGDSNGEIALTIES